MSPARRAETSRVPTVHTKILRLTMIHPRSTYFFFFFCSPGPSSQLCWVSSKGRESAALSRSCRFLLLSSSVAESVAFISRGPPHGSLPYMMRIWKSSGWKIHEHRQIWSTKTKRKVCLINKMCISRQWVLSLLVFQSGLELWVNDYSEIRMVILSCMIWTVALLYPIIHLINY